MYDSTVIQETIVLFRLFLLWFRLFLVLWIWKQRLWWPASVSLHFFPCIQNPHHHIPARQGPERRTNANVRKTHVSKPNGERARLHTSSCVHDWVMHKLLLAVFVTIPLTQRPSGAPPEVELGIRIEGLEYLPWSIISYLESSWHYLRSFQSFMHVQCEENLSIAGFKSELMEFVSNEWSLGVGNHVHIFAFVF